jgi:hypothetical protein
MYTFGRALLFFFCISFLRWPAQKRYT